MNAAPTAGKIVERIAPILGVVPKLPEDERKFDEKVLASYRETPVSEALA